MRQGDRKLTKKVTETQRGLTLRMAELVSMVNSPPSATIVLGGETISGVPIMNGVLDTTSTTVWVAAAGNGQLLVIGTVSANAQLNMLRLRLSATNDAGLASIYHAFQIGPDDGLNLVMDNNELMVRNNGAASTLFLNNDGGEVRMGGGANIGFHLNVGTTLGVDGAATFDSVVTFAGGSEITGAGSAIVRGQYLQLKAPNGSDNAIVGNSDSAQRLTLYSTSGSDRPYFAIHGGVDHTSRCLYIGYPSTSDDTVYMVAQKGDISINPAGILILNSTLDLNGYVIDSVNEIRCNTGSGSGDAAFTFVGEEGSGMHFENGNLRFSHNSSLTIQVTDPGVGGPVLQVFNPNNPGVSGSGYYSDRLAATFRTGSASAASTVAGISFWQQYSTDRHVCMQVFEGSGDRLAVVNAENSGFLPISASAFTVVSSSRYKKRIRTARDEGGLLDYAVPGDRELAFRQARKVRPVLFDDEVQERLKLWECPKHETRDECEDCPESSVVEHHHICDDWECGGTNDRPCWLIEQHVDRPGLIAEELQEIYPKAVAKNKDGSIQGIDYAVLTVELFNTVQHMLEDRDELLERISALEASIKTKDKS